MKKLFIILAICFLSSALNAQIPEDLLPMPREESIDSLESLENRVNFRTGFSGTVAEGYVAYADSTGALQVATWSTPMLNRRTIIGFGTGVAGKLRIAGIGEANAATKIGISYYLGPGGGVVDSIPKAGNTWVVLMGTCIDTGEVQLDDPIKVIRRWPQ